MASALSSFLEWFLIGFIFILPFLYKKSTAFQYYLKFSMYYSYLFIVCTVLLPWVICFPRDVTNYVTASRLLKHASYIVGIKYEKRGMEHFDNDEPAIVVANHQSSLDLIGMFTIWDRMRRCTVIAKRSLMYMGSFGIGSWFCGIVFIDRLHPNVARDQVSEATKKIVTDKVKLWIFPEGTRSNTGTIKHFKKGAFYQAIDAQIPILPVVMSQYYFLDDVTKTFDSGQIIITALPPVPTKGLTRDDLGTLSDRVREMMMNVFQETSKNFLNQNKLAM